MTTKGPESLTTNAKEREELIRIIAALTEDGHSVAVPFNKLVTKASEIGAFDWRFHSFTKAQNRTWFGKLFSRNCGTFTLPGGRQVDFSREGSDQSRYYVLKIRAHSIIANCES